MNDVDGWYGAQQATFGDRVAAAREQANLSQSALAKHLGIRVSTLRAWEEDLNEPRANRLSMLAGVLNVSIVWLITGEGEGMEAPEEGSFAVPEEARDLLTELRTLKADLAQKSDQLGRLEKQLRRVLLDTADV